MSSINRRKPPWFRRRKFSGFMVICFIIISYILLDLFAYAIIESIEFIYLLFLVAMGKG
jgi:hypothetical protein